MKTKNSSPARNVVLAALFLALAFVLPMVTGRQYALPDAFPHPALRLRAGRALGSGCGLCGPAAPLGALRDAPDVSHRHFDGF